MEVKIVGKVIPGKENNMGKGTKPHKCRTGCAYLERGRVFRSWNVWSGLRLDRKAEAYL